MKMKHGLSLTAVCAASLLAGNVSAAVIGPIATEVSDIELRGASHAWVGQTTARIGRDVAAGGLGNNYLAVFALPTLASGESISSADFQFNLKTTATNFNGEDPFNIDVYGVRGSNSSAVIDVADFFVGADDTGTTKIEDDILTLGAGPSTGSAPGVLHHEQWCGFGGLALDVVWRRRNPRCGLRLYPSQPRCVGILDRWFSLLHDLLQYYGCPDADHHDRSRARACFDGIDRCGFVGHAASQDALKPTSSERSSALWRRAGLLRNQILLKTPPSLAVESFFAVWEL